MRRKHAGVALVSPFVDLPISDALETERQVIADLARACCAAGQARYAGQIAFQRRLMQAFSADASGQLNQKAQAWWELSLNQLGGALKQSFKLPSNPLKNPRAAGGINLLEEELEQ